MKQFHVTSAEILVPKDAIAHFPQIFGRAWPRRRTTIVFVLILALVFLYPPKQDAVTLSTPKISLPVEDLTHITTSKRAFWHFLIPASRGDRNLCKTILSAALLNYSTPTIINWGRKYEDSSLSDGGSHLGKISGILDYLTGLTPEYDEDLVLVVDGYDMWFQLKPDVLLSRYYAINQRAQQRISERLCGSSSCSNHGALSHISQKIVFSAQKVCWPHEEVELACYGAPPSMLPEEVFGPKTDRPWFGDAKMRTRYINSGFAMGPVREMRRLFGEASRRMKLDSHHGSDQGILSDIIGEQEYARELVRSEYRRRQPSFQRLLERLFKRTTAFDIDRDAMLAKSSSREVLSPMPEPGNLSALRELEYGIGLDYLGELSHATVFAHRDADWVTFAKPELPSQYWHIVSPAIGKAGLPVDIKEATAPFISASPNTSDWSLLSLYTNLYTGIIPATIHHNAWQHNMKSLRTKMWSQMWWEPYVTDMFRANNGLRKTPVAVEVDDEGRKEWWSPVRRAGVRLDNGTLTSFKEFCRGDLDLVGKD